MTARRIVVAVLALAESDSRYVCARRRCAQGGARAAAARAVAAGAAAAVRLVHPTPGNLMTGAWGEQALTPDARGWGWMVKQYVEKAQRPLWNQAKEKLLNDGKVTSVTISSFQPERTAKRGSTGTTSGSRCSTARCRSPKSRR